MRISRPIAKVAVAALVATSAIGVVGSSAATAAPVIPSAAPALSWLERELTDNGGTLPFPPFPGFPPAVDWGLTIDAILALNAGGRGSGTAATTAIEALAAHINDYVTGGVFDPTSVFAGQVGKAMFVALAEGADIHSFGGVDLEALSRSTLKPTGIFQGRFANISPDPDFSNGIGQALNILGLSKTTGGVPADALDFLLAQQCPSGGFRLFYDATVPADSTRGCTTDAEADTDATAFAVEALLTVADPASSVTLALDAATGFLIRQQDPVTGGVHGTGPTVAANANTSGIAARALAEAGFPDAAARARDFVGSLQLNPSNTAGTPAVGEEGAIALNQGGFDDAVHLGIDAGGRDQWRRATTQAVLALIALPRADVVSVQAARLLDTRPGEPTVDGKQAGGGLAAAGSTLVLQVAGRGGVPVDASAVVLNVTAVGASGPGFLTAYPCDTARSTTSSVNFTTNTPITNQVVTGLSAAGTVCLFIGVAAVNVVADIGGYFPAGTGYHALRPARLLDTRPAESTVDGAGLGAGPVHAGSTLALDVGGRGGVPTNVGAVVLNVTATAGTNGGFVTVFPCGGARPLASSLNFGSSAAIANTVVTQLSGDGKVCLFVGGGGAVDLVADVVGYFPAGSGYHTLLPARLLDTRPGQLTVDGKALGAGTTPPGSTLVLPVAGRGGVPAGAASVVLNITADGATGSGFVTVNPCDHALTVASNLNFVANAPAANGSMVPLAADGTVCLFVGGAGAVHLIVDVSGYFG